MLTKHCTIAVQSISGKNVLMPPYPPVPPSHYCLFSFLESLQLSRHSPTCHCQTSSCCCLCRCCYHCHWNCCSSGNCHCCNSFEESLQHTAVQHVCLCGCPKCCCSCQETLNMPDAFDHFVSKKGKYARTEGQGKNVWISTFKFSVTPSVRCNKGAPQNFNSGWLHFQKLSLTFTAK